MKEADKVCWEERGRSGANLLLWLDCDIPISYVDCYEDQCDSIILTKFNTFNVKDIGVHFRPKYDWFYANVARQTSRSMHHTHLNMLPNQLPILRSVQLSKVLTLPYHD